MKETTLAGCVDIRETTRRGRAEQSPKQQQLEKEQHTTDNKSSDREGATQQHGTGAYRGAEQAEKGQQLHEREAARIS